MWPDRHQWSGRSADSHRLFQFLGRPECDLLARLDLAVAPVAGFRPILAARFRTWSIPRPVRRNLAPFFRWRVVSVTKSPSTASACFFAMSWLSANSAARCLSVTVGCAAAFAGAAFFAAAFLGAGAAFLAGGTTISCGTMMNGRSGCRSRSDSLKCTAPGRVAVRPPPTPPWSASAYRPG
jgi:hypothetical protein